MLVVNGKNQDTTFNYTLIEIKLASFTCGEVYLARKILA